MQLLHVVTLLRDEFEQAVISRQQRDYVWIMARTAQIPDADYQRLLKLVAEQGYDMKHLQKVPQQWK